MEDALRCAQRALEMGEVPVGAVVVCEGKIVGRGWNRNIVDSDPTAHAEIVALREAGATVGNHRLGECELFVTIEPCAMCSGALVHARIKRLVYGSDDPKAGAVHSVMQVVNHPQLNHTMEVQGGVLGGRSAEVLQTFFRNRRQANGTARHSEWREKQIPRFGMTTALVIQRSALTRAFVRRGEVREWLKRSASKASFVSGRWVQVSSLPLPGAKPKRVMTTLEFLGDDWQLSHALAVAAKMAEDLIGRTAMVPENFLVFFRNVRHRHRQAAGVRQLNFDHSAFVSTRSIALRTVLSLQ
jgi:tRNA(adenine34) deaminase